MELETYVRCWTPQYFTEEEIEYESTCMSTRSEHSYKSSCEYEGGPAREVSVKVAWLNP